MTEQTARELLMDYLYDEISADDKKKLEAYLAGHPELKHELEQLRRTQSTLQQMPEAPPAEKFLVMDPANKPSPTGWWQNIQWLLPHSGWARTALATAACLMLLLITGALVDLNIQSSEAGFTVSFGEPIPIQSQETGLTEAQAEAILQQIQRENAAILTEYADMLNKHNQQQLQQFAEYFERQRLNDLQTINQALNQYQEKTDYQLKQTHQVLGEVIQTVAQND